MLVQEARNSQRVLTVPLHPEWQRLDSLQKQERVERADRRSDVAQQLHTKLNDVGDVCSEIRFVEDVGIHQPVIAGVWRAELREAARALPVERSSVDHDAADRRA